MSDKSKHCELPKSESCKARRKSFATMKDAPNSRNYPIIKVTKKAIVLCTYNEVGCEFYISKDNLEDLMKHTHVQMEYHLQLMNEAYKKIKSENDDLKKKYEKLKSEWNTYHMKIDHAQPKKRANSEHKLSPTSVHRTSLSPTPYTPERRLSEGRISPSGRRNSKDILYNVLNTEFVGSSNKLDAVEITKELQ